MTNFTSAKHASRSAKNMLVLFEIYFMILYCVKQIYYFFKNACRKQKMYIFKHFFTETVFGDDFASQMNYCDCPDVIV